MLLSKKETPKQFIGMWWSGVFNLLVGMINVFIYTQNDSIMSLLCACFSVTLAVFIFVVIKRKTHEMTWAKLVQKEDTLSPVEKGL